MNIFARPEYRSEFTLFINDWKLRDPDIQAGQDAGRALLEGKPPLDRSVLERSNASRIKRKSYAYA